MRVAGVAVALAALGALGCGRRATQADCLLIVDKSVELQMKEMSSNSAPDIQKRAEQVREALQSDLAACEGRRVTDRTIACVRAAPTTLELDECLR